MNLQRLRLVVATDYEVYICFRLMKIQIELGIYEGPSSRVRGRET